MPTKVGFEHFVFLSTDTTGIDDDDELLRVTLMDSKGEVIYSAIARPTLKTSWEQAERLHGICASDVKEHGLSLDDIGFEVQTHLKKYSRVVMYNADFHKRFFPNYWLTDKVVICAMQWSLAYINNHPSYEHLSTYLKLPVLAALLEVDPLYNDPNYDLEIDLEWGGHTSLNQCKLIRKVWLKMAKTAYQLDNKIGFELLDSTNTLLPTS